MKKLITAIVILSMMLSTLFVVVSADEEQTTDLLFAGAFGNDMVLQRDTEVNVWGTSTKIGKTVTVSFKGNTVEGTVGEDGKWKVQLPKMEKDKNENDLVATCDGETVTLTGILVGDVYLVGGQSNAEKSLSACGTLYSKEYKQSLIDKNENMVRYFTQGKADATNHPETMETPQENPIKGKKWKKETSTSANSFSAMGFFFAHKVATELDVPVGMIMVCSAGSPVSQLMSKEASEATGYDRFENNIPVSGMYNALMNPFINMTVKAMLYYQGESEQGLAKSDYGKYNVYVNAYVEDLRSKMNQQLPFFFVQISSHDGQGLTSWPNIGLQRAVQFDGLSVIKNSGMIVSMDQGYRAGESDFAHPNYKEPVGNRLADLVLARLFNVGDEEQVTSPMPDYAYKTDEGIVIHFTHVAGGLKKIGSFEKLTGFKAVIADGSFRDVDAQIINENEVLLDTKEISGITIGVGYGLEILAFSDYDGDAKYIANLGGGNDLPAPTFKLTNILDEKPGAAPGENTENTDVTTDGAENGTVAKANNSTVYIIIGVVAAVVIVAGVVIAVTAGKKKKENK